MNNHQKQTKIVATIGPSCESPAKIKSLLKAGVNVFRFNLKHNVIAWHGEKIELVQKCADELGVPVAILIDLIGRDLRLGKVENGGILLKKGDEVIFADQDNAKSGEIPIRSYIAYKHLKVGQKFSADSGAFSFVVTKKTDRYFQAKVTQGGFLKENKGVNFPDLEVDLPALVEHDLEHLTLAAKHDVDFVALSFVCERNDMIILKNELKKMKVRAKVIAKIENTLGVKNFDEILDESDGIMVARGDLGVEVPIEQIPVLQKQMITKCLQVRKPVITATQMMESMLNSLLPSRSDVSDVANAVFDYTDAVMLSGETAGGNYPVETVKRMSEILYQAEKNFADPQMPYASTTWSEAIAQAGLQLTHFNPQKGKKPVAVVALTETGNTARVLSRFRPSLPIIAITCDEKTRDELCLTWGVRPYYLNFKNKNLEFQEIFDFVRKNNIVKRGELVILISGGLSAKTARNNMVTLKEIW